MAPKRNTSPLLRRVTTPEEGQLALIGAVIEQTGIDLRPPDGELRLDDLEAWGGCAALARPGDRTGDPARGEGVGFLVFVRERIAVASGGLLCAGPVVRRAKNAKFSNESG